MPLPKYAFNLTEGVLRVVRTDGAPITDEEREWFRTGTSNRLKVEALANTLTHQKSAELDAAGIPKTGETRGGVRFDIDPAISELEAIREARLLSKTRVASMWGGKAYQLTDWARGWSRPHMENLRAWAGALGRALVLVPAPLVPQVRQMIQEWEAQNEPPLSRDEEAA